jgi:hypothetical protein
MPSTNNWTGNRYACWYFGAEGLKLAQALVAVTDDNAFHPASGTRDGKKRKKGFYKELQQHHVCDLDHVGSKELFTATEQCEMEIAMVNARDQVFGSTAPHTRTWWSWSNIIGIRSLG